MAAHFFDFEAGMMVDFSSYAFDEYAQFVKLKQKELGKGPYLVTKVESVFERHPCDCEAGQNDLRDWHHSEKCRARSSLKGTDHHQWITIKTQAGERAFSGAYFEQVGVRASDGCRS